MKKIQLKNFAKIPTPKNRKLDVIVPSFNRPLRLYNFLKSAIKQNIKGMYLVIIDDGSTLKEKIPNLGTLNTKSVCKSFKSPNILYYRNTKNSGLAVCWEKFYNSLCDSKYTLSVTDKDEFINGESIKKAIKTMDNDENISVSLIPLRQKDRSQDDYLFNFKYRNIISGKEFLYNYIRDTNLMHCSMWGIYRFKHHNSLNKPRSLDLWSYGLDDSFGLDLDFVWNAVVKGDVIFFQKPHIKRSTLEGGTEKFPLTFAYTYYQYAKRITREMYLKNIIDKISLKKYRSMWLKLILNGFVISLNHWHGTEQEIGRSRIKKHLKRPLIIYVLLEFVKNSILFDVKIETIKHAKANIKKKFTLDKELLRLFYKCLILGFKKNKW